MADHTEWRQFRLLAVHFFRRFFDNDLLTPGADSTAVVVRALGLLATPGMMVALYLMPRYVELEIRSPQLLPAARRFDQMMFLTLATSIMGFVAALEWDALFPDRLDYQVLTQFPIRQRTAFAAKVTSLVAFLLLFTAAVNFLPALLFPFIAPAGKGAHWYDVLQFALVNATVLLCASALVFLAVMAIQGILLNLLPERWFRIASGYAQFGVMASMITILLLYPRATQILQPGKTLDALRLYPPAWFVALSERWMHRSNFFFEPLADRALNALALCGVLAAVFYAIAYRRHVGRSLESMEESRSAGLLVRIRDIVLSRFVSRSQTEFGVLVFTWNTLFRSSAHKLIFSAYMGVAAALVVWELVSLFAKRSYAVALEPIPELLCIPLVLSFITLSAMRFVFPRPAELKANWLFRLAEHKQSGDGLVAAEKIMLCLGILPVVLLPLPLHWSLWGWRVAAVHCAYTLLLGLILRGFLLLDFRKLPFTCAFAPAGPGAVAWGTIYFFVFSTYAYSMAKLERWMLDRPVRLGVMFACLAVALGVVEYLRSGLTRSDHELVFEDAIEPAVRVLGLGQ